MIARNAEMSGASPSQQSIRAAERAHDRIRAYELKLIEAATRDAQEAIKVALAINGGAAVAILAFTGAIAYRAGVRLDELKYVLIALGCFAVGVVFAAATAACAYFSNSLYSAWHGAKKLDWKHPYVHETKHSQRFFRWARRTNWVAVLCAAAALVLFLAGIALAGLGMTNLALLPRSYPVHFLPSSKPLGPTWVQDRLSFSCRSNP